MTLLSDTFQTELVDCGGVRISCAVGGDGPPLLLLHGYPQTHLMWHRVAPELAREHTVVCADLRGYGASDKPAAGDGGAGYDKRTMAADQLALMAALGFERFALAGHDRGARVAHRLALDAPQAVTRLALLDIVPTRHVYGHVDRALATAYYHWFLLSRSDGLPERLLAAEPEAWVRSFLGGLGTPAAAFDAAAIAEYVRRFADPAAIAASCADYRAAAGLDLEHDEASFAAGRRIDCPLLVLWGAHGFVDRYDVAAVWSGYATELRTARLDCGHFLPEEAPARVTAALAEFLAGEAVR